MTANTAINRLDYVQSCYSSPGDRHLPCFPVNLTRCAIRVLRNGHQRPPVRTPFSPGRKLREAPNRPSFSQRCRYVYKFLRNAYDEMSDARHGNEMSTTSIRSKKALGLNPHQLFHHRVTSPALPSRRYWPLESQAWGRPGQILRNTSLLVDLLYLP